MAKTPAERAINNYGILEREFEDRMGVDIKTFTKLVGNGKPFPSADSLRDFLNGRGLEIFGKVPSPTTLKGKTVGDLALAYSKLGVLA